MLPVKLEQTRDENRCGTVAFLRWVYAWDLRGGGRDLLNLLSELTPNGNSTTGSGSRCHNEEVDEDFPESEYILSSTGISGKKNLKV